VQWDVERIERSLAFPLDRALPALIAGLIGLALGLRFVPHPAPGSGPVGEALSPLATYCVELLCVALIVAGVAVSARGTLVMPPAHEHMTSPASASTRPVTIGRRVLDCVVALVVGVFAAVVLAGTVLAQPVMTTVTVLLVGGAALVLHVLDPRDRPRVRLPLAALGTALLGAFAWTELADLVLARGLGVPPGTVDADLMSRVIVTGLLLVPSLVAGAFGGAAVYAVRRQSRIGAALLALLVSLASALALMAGLRYVSSEARALPHHPGRGRGASWSTPSRSSDSGPGTAGRCHRRIASSSATWGSGPSSFLAEEGSR